MDILDAALVTCGNERTGSFSLKPSPHVRIIRQRHRSLEMLTGWYQVTMEQIRFADRFFQRKLLVSQPQRFGTIARATVSGNDFVDGKHALSFGGGALRVSQTVFVIA